MIVEWTKPAVRDLVALRAYIARDNPRAAEETAAKVIAAAEGLVVFPARGRPGRKPATRELVITDTPFAAVYRVRDEIVEVLRVLRGARRWP